MNEGPAERAPISFRSGKFPNGWPHPTFMYVDEDGTLSIEWIFGEQGAPSSWRVLFTWSAIDGAMCCRTCDAGQIYLAEEEGDEGSITKALKEWLSSPTGSNTEGSGNG